MSYIELVGTLFYLWSVWLIARRNIWTWPIGILSVSLYLLLFYQIQLYSDAIEQIYYLGASGYGWWRWLKYKQETGSRDRVQFSSSRVLTGTIGLTLALALIAGVCMRRIHLWFPVFFPEPASYPFLDAGTTILSFTAMLLMAYKRTESWIYWIVVDVIGIWLYYVKEVRFVALLYVILLGMAAYGLRSWLNPRRNSLKSLAGGWSDQEAAEFSESVESCEQIDEDLWK
ncbi:MAG: nicotinamide riboside transporter PnuC [Desulfobacteraceae bacterium]|nr:MAG: nicotinamide riboside transporter PnuC [Desulfobacteraceae bacterium]